MDKESLAHPHTIKKFELVATYVKSWIEKLMNNRQCQEVIFIDCMCNSGIYKDSEKESIVEGTPIRVAKIIKKAMEKYTNKRARLYFNDKSEDKIIELKKYLPGNTNNFQINLSVQDGNELLKNLNSQIKENKGVHCLLFYDPFGAEIDWEALEPYFFGWGEVILNHMDSDTKRGVKLATRIKTVAKYERTYLTAINDLVNIHGDKNAYELLIEKIIKDLQSNSKRKYYLAAVPFFIKTNTEIYNIIFFTKHIEGFKLFKKTAWKIFGGKSSNQNTHGLENQTTLDFGAIPDEKQCYYVSDIADYVFYNFKGRINVSLKEIWDMVDNHPIFPTDDYKNKIKNELRIKKCKLHQNTIDFV